jgi:hypothetical protein
MVCSITKEVFFLKKILYPLLSTFGTMALLYWIGNEFNISLLEFSFVLNEPLEEGMFFGADIAILPIIIGLIVGYIVERRVKAKADKAY